MTVLALDTASSLSASIAVLRDGQLAASVTLTSATGFAHLLFGAIQDCLTRSHTPLSAIDCFAAGSGPGSFTGVRIGLTAVKGLAESMGKPVFAISNLRALASSFRKNADRLTAVALDARRGEVYAAVYDGNGRPSHPETVLLVSDWLRTLDPAAPYEFISPAPLPLAGTPFEAMPFTQADAPLARAIAVLAEADMAAGLIADSAQLDANYVRRSDAELFWKE